MSQLHLFGGARAPILRVHADGLVVDNFAGGGGASLGIEWALGRAPDLAVNHDPEAIAMHAANHPTTRHYCESVWTVDPREACGGRPVALAWFSPDCKHHSKAKGGKPVDKHIRGLAWVVVKWARAVKPRVIVLENVEEFADWGPLVDGRPDPARKGHTFRRWLGQLQAAGYRVEMRQLRGSDYGAPTIRRRLFVIARADGEAIIWPDETHGPGRAAPHRVAAECIDWSLPCPSIFERKRPLAEATLRRIGRGIWKFVIGAAQPFIVRTDMHLSNAGCIYPLGEPLRTVTTGGGLAVVAPTLIQTSYGERVGQAPRSLDLHQPLGTVVAGGVKHALVAAFLAKHYGGNETPGAPLQRPTSTVTAKDHHALVTSHLLKLHGTCRDGQPITDPLPTVRAEGTHLAEVRAFLIKYYGAAGQAQGLIVTSESVGGERHIMFHVTGDRDTALAAVPAALFERAVKAAMGAEAKGPA